MKGATVVEPIAREEFETRLAELCLKSAVAGFPRKHKDRHILLKRIVLTVDVGRDSSEAEIDERIIFWLSDVARSIDFDHVSLRRLLVDERYLERDDAGSVYGVSASGAVRQTFEPDVDRVDVYESIGRGMKQIAQKKEAYTQGPNRSTS